MSRERRARMNFDSLKTAVNNKGNYEEDKRIFALKPKEDGTASAIIRFLPSPDTDLPFVKVYNHGFKGPAGSWYIENCPTTVGGQCPACVQNSYYWNNGQEETARERKRKLSFYANILVLKDENCPEREGKVFIFRYGKKIQTKIEEAIDGKIEAGFNPFDYYEGANFVLTQKQVGGYANFDSSRFKDPTPISREESFIDDIDTKLFELKPFIADKQFKDFNTLAETYAKKTGVKVKIDADTSSANDELDSTFAKQTASRKEQVMEDNIDGDAVQEPTELSTPKSKLFEKLRNKKPSTAE